MTFLSIVTPTFNRATLLPALFDSIKSQTVRNFEWVIADDDSSDGTPELVAEFQSEADFPIRYLRKENGGKHRVVNQAVRAAQGELVFIVDSDDRLTPDAAEWIERTWNGMEDKGKFAGLSGIRINPDGTKIGGGGDFGVIDATPLDIRFVHHVNGDLAEVFRREILLKTPFPEIPGEKFCPEALVWNRLAVAGLSLRYVHHGIYICKYLPGGLTSKITRLRHESPVASMTYYSELFHATVSYGQKMKAAVNYWRFHRRGKGKWKGMASPLSLMCFFPGKLFRVYDSINKI